MKSIEMNLSLNSIRTDGDTQVRAGLNQEVVAEYAQGYRDKKSLPRIVVFHDGSEYWLADGFHRVAGAKKAKLEMIAAEVRQGTLRDAILFSCGANKEHGLRRSNEDKRRAVEKMLRDEEWVKWTNSRIAEHCGVSHTFVNKMRDERSGPLETVSSRVGKDGRTINVDKIGKRPAAAGEVGGEDSTPALQRQAAAPALPKQVPEHETEDNTATEEHTHTKQVQTVSTREPEGDLGDDTAPERIFDAEGHEVPEGLREVFAACPDFDRSLAALERAAMEIEALARQPGGVRVEQFLKPPTPTADGPRLLFPGFVETRERLTHDRPHSVCPVCSGLSPGSCHDCDGKGWVTSMTWKYMSEEKKAKLPVVRPPAK